MRWWCIKHSLAHISLTFLCPAVFHIETAGSSHYTTAHSRRTIMNHDDLEFRSQSPMFQSKLQIYVQFLPNFLCLTTHTPLRTSTTPQIAHSQYSAFAITNGVFLRFASSHLKHRLQVKYS